MHGTNVKITHYVFCVHSAYVIFLYIYEYTYCSVFYNQPWKKFAQLFMDGYKMTVQGVVWSLAIKERRR